MSQNPPAFPQQCADALDVGMVHEGMSLRDYFAGQVVPAMIERYLVDNGTGIGADHLYLNVPVHAYRFADAMLVARAGGSSS